MIEEKVIIDRTKFYSELFTYLNDRFSTKSDKYFKQKVKVMKDWNFPPLTDHRVRIFQDNYKEIFLLTELPDHKASHTATCKDFFQTFSFSCSRMDINQLRKLAGIEGDFSFKKDEKVLKTYYKNRTFSYKEAKQHFITMSAKLLTDYVFTIKKETDTNDQIVAYVKEPLDKLCMLFNR